ncbi:dynamin family protein [Aliarcobacter cibarius]|uniref:ATP-binding protein n=1 Tax=Aliarcobacter cibarius TaxID=255507 RepID=A0ABY2VBP6_9BACT|nr:dynamin family protein [Aliarcobacter cibarius]TLT01047.1 ATP-binding protein [Aliarcobacter cibarius]TLT01144.1 ATP-binding protein [Aliarcobacter cibarius]
MSLTNDYFLLYHGITFQKNLEIEEIETKLNDDTFTIFALIISANRKNYEKFINLTSFKTLCQQLNIKTPSNANEFYHIQENVIELILSNRTKSNLEILSQSFEYLRNENIIDNDSYTKLNSLFDHKELESLKDDESAGLSKIDDDFKTSFKDLKHNIENILVELKAEITNHEVLSELNSVNEYINNQKFSIGITGVMNAGKSTMLNALMGKEILGSAVVPETANLTIVKHNTTDNAKVYYWNTKEWEKIEESAKSLESMKDFVLETNKVFGENLKNYIRPTSRFDEVDINDLSSYTSAEHSGKKCNLVKYVELGSNLKFLSDGIEIVDTPGLDDPVIQREEITKEYISKCDMMIHLMNVSQSATLKDVEFIIDAVLYQNISKLLVVITRADTVSKKNLEEVIEYTKSSIQKQLKAQNKDSQLDHILKTIKFIPISGRMALLHRTGREKEALEAGFTLEDTGILEIENYLMESLFGTNSQKGDLVIQSAKTQLNRLIEKQIVFNNYELTLLNKSKDELKQELNEFNRKKDSNKRILFSMSEDINYYKNDAKSYIDSLETFLQSELMELQNVIKQRVVNDTRYSLEKTKRKPENARVKVIVETAIKDGIIDVIRDYRYKFIKKSQTIGEQCEQKYHDLGFAIGHKNDNFDARGFFQDDFKSGFLTSNNEIMISQIINAVNGAKEGKLNELDRNIEEIVKAQFKGIEEDIKIKAKKVSSLLIENFFDTLNAPLRGFEQRLKNEEESLQNRIATFEENDKNKAELSINLHKNIKKLENIMLNIKGLH